MYPGGGDGPLSLVTPVKHSRGRTVESVVEIPHPKDCQCHGTGWIEIPDATVGAYMVARCPGPQLTLWDADDYQ